MAWCGRPYLPPNLAHRYRYRYRYCYRYCYPYPYPYPYPHSYTPPLPLPLPLPKGRNVLMWGGGVSGGGGGPTRDQSVEARGSLKNVVGFPTMYVAHATRLGPHLPTYYAL